MRVMQLVVLVGIIQLSQNPTGTIDGVVTQSGTNFPIAGVQVKVLTSRPDSSSPSVFGEATSDGAGVFGFSEVPPGPYVIEVSKENYVFGAMPAFNATATLRIVVNPAQRLRVPVSGIRAAVIRGRVLDEDGRGLSDMPVEILQSGRNAQGQPIWRGLPGWFTGIRTNDQGEYEKSLLSPGQYVVRTAWERPDTPRAWVYSPGTSEAFSAALLDLREGSEITADIRIAPAIDRSTYKISGKVVVSAGEGTRIGLILRRRPSNFDPLFALEGSPRTFTDADARTGKYEFRGVRPGIYDLYAAALIDGKDHLSKTVVEVRDFDLGNVDLAPQTGIDLKGRLVIDGNPRDLQFRRSASADDSRDPNRSHAGDVSISLHRTDGLFSDTMFKPEIGDDGVSFTFRNVPMGDYEVIVSFVPDGGPPSPDLYAADIRAAGRSVIDTGFEVGTDDVDAMEVIIGTEGASIKGIIQGRRANASGFLILVPPIVREGTEAYKALPIPMNGNDQFEFRGLRPGNYKILAVQANGDFFVPRYPPLSGGQAMQIYLTPEFLSQNEAGTVSVTVQKGLSITSLRVPFISSAR